VDSGVHPTVATAADPVLRRVDSRVHADGSRSASSTNTNHENPAAKAKNPAEYQLNGVFLITSLTITYFHTGCSTIIGAKSFHGPVRDGKGWDRLAMVIRHNLYELLSTRTTALNLEEVSFGSERFNKQHTVSY
jgi:hypothetical protein